MPSDELPSNEKNDSEIIDISLSYDDAIKYLDTIVAQIESGNVPIDDMIQKVEEASRYIRFCREKIVSTEKKVDQLVEALQNEIDSTH